jgi:DnaJ-class molecular chaperone
MSNECFADEIAIDFPSVGNAVERMRHAFLGEPDSDDVITTEVCLSSREAFDGSTIPIEVPVRATCPACGGRGEVWTERCGGCRGTGGALFHHSVRVSLPAGVVDGARLRFRVRSPCAPPVRVEVRIAVRASA